MNCCDNGSNHRANTHKHTHLHRWMMICCILPIVLIALFFVYSLVTGMSFNYLVFALVLLCPLSHLFLMPLMARKNKRGISESKKME